MTSVMFQDELPNTLAATKIYHYRPDKRTWKHVSISKGVEQSDHPSSLQIVTWNIDFLTLYVKERMSAALRHLEKDVFRCGEGKEPVACCIMFQEVHADALPHLLEDDWVRKHFMVTPISPNKWPMAHYENVTLYGNVTLISRTIAVSRVSILKFGYSNMGRGAIVVDVKVTTPRAHNPRDMTLRIINTHLESLPQGSRMRPPQLEVLVSLLNRKQEVRGGVIAGDMNSISPTDMDLPAELGLKDAWTKFNEDPSGFTWGYQDRCEFPPGRLDKILYVKRKAYEIDSPKKIGEGVRVTDEVGEFVAWASDHFGLSTPLRVLG